MKRGTGILFVAAMFLMLGAGAGCAGMRFGSAWSMYNKQYFAEPPQIVKRLNDYSIQWRYGAMGFYFFPSSKVINGRLVFALEGTSSSGSLSGRFGEQAITKPKEIRAIETGGAFWLEPDGREIALKMVHDSR
jgi:hypothetical protein